MFILKVAGMLIYYILSGGHHPFGDSIRCQINILDGQYNLKDVQDEVAKDLIEQMINEDPKKRPKVEECLAHPYFWSNKKYCELANCFHCTYSSTTVLKVGFGDPQGSLREVQGVPS